jgi:hypothetical protein
MFDFNSRDEQGSDSFSAASVKTVAEPPDNWKALFDVC